MFSAVKLDKCSSPLWLTNSNTTSLERNESRDDENESRIRPLKTDHGNKGHTSRLGLIDQQNERRESFFLIDPEPEDYRESSVRLIDANEKTNTKRHISKKQYVKDATRDRAASCVVPNDILVGRCDPHSCGMSQGSLCVIRSRRLGSRSALCKDVAIELVNHNGLEHLSSFTTKNMNRIRSFLKNIYGGPMQGLKSLKTLMLSNCPKLTWKLILIDMPQLRSILVRNSIEWPSLQRLKIHGCPKLKRLPLKKDGVVKLTSIEAEKSWWEALENDQEVTDKFQRYCTLM
ncbi:NB-ARC domains-containing protein [Tanacetum coccineum]